VNAPPFRTPPTPGKEFGKPSVGGRVLPAGHSPTRFNWLRLGTGDDAPHTVESWFYQIP